MSLKVESLSINSIGGINALSLSFNDKVNIICGPNGVGKTTILEAVALSFTQHVQTILRKKADSETGTWTTNIKVNGEPSVFQFSTKYFHPGDSPTYTGSQTFYIQANNVLNFKASRAFDYFKLDAVHADQSRQPYAASEFLMIGTQIPDIKHWFVNRFTYKPHEEGLNEYQRANFDTAASLFNLIDRNVRFSRVKIDTHDIMVRTSSGSEIYYEYLSSGFKSLIALFVGIIKEVEYRMKDPYVRAADFAGVVIIDEIDLHLHPSWQAKIVPLFKQVFPRAQLIASTHSPHVIQAAAVNEIIALQVNPDTGSIEVREVPSTEFGYQGWTIEEILSDVMGLEVLHSPIYLEATDSFNRALDDGNLDSALDAFRVLDKILHPRNPLRKIFELQLGLVEGANPNLEVNQDEAIGNG